MGQDWGAAFFCGARAPLQPQRRDMVQGAGNPTGMGTGKWCECGETMEGKSHDFAWMVDRKAADRKAGTHCDTRVKVEIPVAGEA